MLTLNRPLGAALKADGQQAAFEFSGKWRDTVVDEFGAWVATQKAAGFRTVTIEAFRAQTNNAPESHKAWGSLPATLCKAGLIAPDLDADGNPRYVRAAAPKTHAHPVRLWRVA